MVGDPPAARGQRAAVRAIDRDPAHRCHRAAGPHSPFDTDLVVAEEVAAAAVGSCGDELECWLLPALSYSKSNEHAWAPGTIWLSATTLLAVLDDIGRCVAALPTATLVFLNGHGGNSALGDALAEISAFPLRRR